MFHNNFRKRSKQDAYGRAEQQGVGGLLSDAGGLVASEAGCPLLPCFRFEEGAQLCRSSQELIGRC
jgi:hypothetical protein